MEEYRVKQKLKRFLAGFMAMITMFMTFVTNGTNAFAASPESNLKIWFSSPRATGEIAELKAGYDHGRMFCYMIDNEVSYCLNYTLEASNGQLMTSGDEPSTELTAEQEKLLHYCLYYGYSNNVVAEPTEVQKDEHAATQATVWMIVKGLFGTSSGDNVARTITNAGYDPEYAYNYYLTLKQNITNAYNMGIPSFAAKQKSRATTYELKWNESNKRFETTITDSNGVLGSYDFSIDGYSVSKSGNKITISSKEVNTTATTGTFTTNTNAVDITDSCVFWLTGDPGDQEMISSKPAADPVHAYIKVKTENIGYGRGLSRSVI